MCARPAFLPRGVFAVDKQNVRASTLSEKRKMSGRAEIVIAAIGAGASGGIAAGLSAARSMLDVVLPAQCPSCDSIVGAQGQLCTACFRKVTLIVPPCCVRCGVGFASNASGGLTLTCPACLESPPAWRFGRAAFAYDDFSRALILPLKYNDRTENARILGRHMARAGRVLLAEADLLVPVPLHRGRLLARRYNQAALLAYEVGRLAGKQVVVDAVERFRQTAPLIGQSPRERAAAVAGAIRVRQSRVSRLSGQHVVLIDDVLTTGATAGVCATALLDAGAASVDVLTAARTAHGEAGRYNVREPRDEE
jgi:ComF family protein